MKISGLIQQERMASLEERRKTLQRKGVGDAYRKNLQYFQPKKNPVLIELENLLFGHKDHDLYDQHKEDLKEVTPQEQATIQEMQQAEKNVRAHEQAKRAFDGELSLTPEDGSKEEQMVHILESVRSAALAPKEPSPQDLRVAESVSLHIPQVEAQLNGTGIAENDYVDNGPAFVRDPIEVNVPDRFTKDLKLNPLADTIFGRSYEESYKANIFKEVAAKYTAHSEMVKNGYLPRYEPTFSWTA